MTYSSEVLADSPYLYWRFGEASGTSVADTSGNGRTGFCDATRGVAGLLTGDPNFAVSNDGTLNRIGTRSDTTDLTAFSIEAWVKQDSTNSGIRYVAGREDAGVSGIFRLMMNNRVPTVDIWSAAGTNATVTGTALTAGTTHHLAATYDGTTLTLYVDGVSVGTPSTTVSGALRTVNTDFTVLASPSGSSRFGGTIDEVAHYTTALSGARVAAHYSAGITASPYPGAVLADTPYLYWRLSETSGTIAADVSGNGRNGTYSGSPTLSASGLIVNDVDTAVTFDGVDDKVVYADTADLTEFTVEAWIKKSSVPGSFQFVAARDDAAGRIFSLAINTSGFADAIVFNSVGSTRQLTGAVNLCDNVPHHLAVTFSTVSTNMFLYVDGVQVATGVRSGTLSTSNVAFAVGNDNISPFNYFTGTIDEVAYYTTALTDTRIAYHAARGVRYSSAVLALNPALYWRMNDLSGSLFDSSGNARTGALGGTAPTYGVTGSPVDNKALTFGGVGGRFEAVATEDLSTGTIVAWMKTSTGSFGANTMMAGRFGATNGTRMMALCLSTTGAPQLQINGTAANTVTDVANRNDGSWHMVVGVLEGVGSGSKTIRIYVDGAETNNAAASIGSDIPAAMSQDTAFSAGGGSATTLRSYTGSLDDVAYFPNIILTPTQISNLYALGLGIQTIAGGLSTETDSALTGSTVVGPITISGGQATETDSTFSGQGVTIISGGLSTETDSTSSGTLSAVVVGSLATESDSALTGTGFDSSTYVFGGQATETDASLSGELILATTSEIDASGEADAHITPSISMGIQQNRVGGRTRTGIAVAEWEPDIDAPPFDRGTRKVVFAQQFPQPVMVGAQPVYTPTFKTEVDYRTRIVVGGKDVSWFRGVATPIPSFEMGEPFGWGTTTINFPQIAPSFEKLGIGSLRWLRPGARVKFQRVDDDTDSIIRTDYLGVVVAMDVRGSQLQVEVGGQLTGRAALREKQPPLVQAREDIGELVADRIRLMGLSHKPPRGRNTGIEIQRFGGQSELEYIQELISLAVTRTGDQWTVKPNDKGIYRTSLKDTETIDGTAYCDDARVVADLRRDIAEEPNRIYATGITKQGMIIKFGAYPGMLKSRKSPYPFNDGRSFGQGTTNEDTNTGDGIGVMLWRLIAMGYLDYRIPVGDFDDEVTEAIEDLQDDVDLPVTGNMNEKTWAALYDISATGYSLRKSIILPAAQTSRTRKWRRTASGSVLGRNPNYDKHTLVVDRSVEMGNGFRKRQIRRWAKNQLAHGDNWVGTITIHSGAIVAGEHDAGGEITEILRGRDIRPGMNILLPHFDGGTLMHVSGTSAAEDDGPVTLVVDTRSRDILEAWEVIQRNRDSRQTPMRSFLRQRRASQMSKDRITYDEVGGIIDDTVSCGADEWTVFPVVASQAGAIQRLELEVTNNCEFAVAVFGKRIRPKKLKSMVGNPLLREAKTQWDNENIRRKLEKNYILLYAAGSNDDPCGYYPKNKSENPNADLTGRWSDDAGFDYVTFHNDNDAGSVLWVAVWTAQNTKIVPGRIMWPLSEEY